MQASELLHDLLGYDDESDYDNYEEQQYQQSEDYDRVEVDFDISGEGEGDELGEAVTEQLYIMMKQREEQNTSIKSNWKMFTCNTLSDNECSICLMEEQLTDLPCSHRFCSDCLSFHVKTQVRSRRIHHVRCYPRRNNEMIEIHVDTLFGVECPHIGCNYVIEDLAPHLNHQDLLLFDDKCLDIAILKMRLRGELQPCPRGCGYIVQQNCFCVNPDCHKRTLWLQKLDEKRREEILRKEKLAQRMAFPHDKKCCPKCFVEISKNGGCDHMHCTLCNTHFSWSAAPEYGISYSWFKEQTTKLFKEPKLIHRSNHHFIHTASPFKKRKYFAKLEKDKRSNKE
eukprot:TRINITY_DN509_c0_g1_i2.p1 TRINITY_DN509_c0_g1~~TRINITY_DN509_c0_g1_i2.p1  ORF type:complete len:340 (+),score=38.75 TRINITY_DN509_c0_g1_i2:48-1067(+)